MSARHATELDGASRAELDRIFAEARAPRLEDLDGDYEGRIVGGSFFPASAAVVVRALGSRWMPWRGKRFAPLGAGEGAGDNRVRLLGSIRGAIPFSISITPSTFDGRPVCSLSYGRRGADGRPPIVRDEIRQVHEGVLLGQGFLDTPGGRRCRLYFTLRRLDGARATRCDDEPR